MDDIRFDGLARQVRTLADRRTTARALAGSALGALGLAAGRGADAKKKKKKKCRTCSVCERCLKGKCKSQPVGSPCGVNAVCADFGIAVGCTCPPGTLPCNVGDLENLKCCGGGLACQPDDTYGGCPAGTSFCAGSPARPFCGRVGDSLCVCVTTLGGATTCAHSFPLAGVCTSDAECTAALGQPGVCVDLCPDCPCEEPTAVCMIQGCAE